MSDYAISYCPNCNGPYASHLGACPKASCDDGSLVDDFIPAIPLRTFKVKARIGNIINKTGSPLDAPKMPQKGASKQRGNKVQADGHTFDSETEYKRYEFLKLMQVQVVISHLEIHPRFELLAKIPKLQSAISYTADFAYFFEGRYYVEDTKGKYGNSERNRKRGIAGKPIISPESRLRHKIFIAKLYAKYGAMFEFKIVTEPTETIS
jgi:hypothetical protein